MKKILIIFFIIGLFSQISFISAKSLYTTKNYKSGKRITIKDKVQRRRITLLEKELMTSKDAKKINLFRSHDFVGMHTSIKTTKISQSQSTHPYPHKL